MTPIEIVQSYDFKVVTRVEFETASDRPNGLLERAAQYAGGWVIDDPIDDDQGFMIIGDDADALAREAIEHLNLEEIEL